MIFKSILALIWHYFDVICFILMTFAVVYAVFTDLRWLSVAFLFLAWGFGSELISGGKGGGN
ncbi:DUF1056 family protein [Liquorilactobacillus capillatus]|uniref:DUF1056 family protein n=1 Tax=Liquorilactobacillus capillatus TaxID=480931 RepID=UPI00070E2A25|nr:DUF1056 family protein [Liquorilactobacillus capillatus]